MPELSEVNELTSEHVQVSEHESDPELLAELRGFSPLPEVEGNTACDI